MNLTRENLRLYPRQDNAQTIIEYMLLLAVVVAIVLVAFKLGLPKTRVSAGIFFNRAVDGILGKPNPCGDGRCCEPFESFAKCPVDCNSVPPTPCP